LQRYIKSQVEREIFLPVLIYADRSPEEAKVRLNWGSTKTPELVPADLIHAAEAGLVFLSSIGRTP